MEGKDAAKYNIDVTFGKVPSDGISKASDVFTFPGQETHGWDMAHRTS